MPGPRPPTGLGPGGRTLWRALTAAHDLGSAECVVLHEACRAKDRADALAAVLRGDPDVWVDLTASLDAPAGSVRVCIDQAATAGNATARGMAQLLAALRLPDPRTGRRTPRPGVRGVYGAGRRGR